MSSFVTLLFKLKKGNFNYYLVVVGELSFLFLHYFIKSNKVISYHKINQSIRLK